MRERNDQLSFSCAKNNYLSDLLLQYSLKTQSSLYLSGPDWIAFIVSRTCLQSESIHFYTSRHLSCPFLLLSFSHFNFNFIMQLSLKHGLWCVSSHKLVTGTNQSSIGFAFHHKHHHAVHCITRTGPDNHDTGLQVRVKTILIINVHVVANSLVSIQHIARRLLWHLWWNEAIK